MSMQRFCLTLVMTLTLVASVLVFAALTSAQDEPLSLGELARRERERERNSTKPARVLTLEDKTLNCQDDWDCLLAAVERKEEARLTFTERLDLATAYGTIHSSDIHMEVRDYGEDTAVMRAWPENSRLQF